MAMSDIARRHQLILQFLPRQPRQVTVTELQQKLENQGLSAGVRTLQRDLQKLSLDYPVIEMPGSGRGNEGAGWAMAKDSKPVIQNLDAASALSLVMARQYLQPLMPAALLEQLDPWVEAAEKTLDQFNGRGFKNWPSRVRAKPRGLQLQPAVICPDVLQIIQQALLEGRQIEAIYDGRKEQRIHPLGLIYRGPVTYLVCRYFDYEDIRLTALHRFSKAILLDAKIKAPAGFNLDDYLQQDFLLPGDTGKEISLKLRFTDHTGDHLKETPINGTQKITDEGDGVLVVTARVMETSELYWWVLGFGDSMEVLSPKPMREWFKLTAKTMGENYDR